MIIYAFHRFLRDKYDKLYKYKEKEEDSDIEFRVLKYNVTEHHVQNKILKGFNHHE